MFLAYQKQTAWVGEASGTPFYEADQFKALIWKQENTEGFYPHQNNGK